MAVHVESVASGPIRLQLTGVALNADLAMPARPRGMVLFAHGSGSGRQSPRNRAIADVLHRNRFGTLLLDLLTEEESVTDRTTAEFRFDIALLADRLVAAIDWVQANPATSRLKIGLFGASTGAAAALIAAAHRPEAVRAVVSRGGRPDLAGTALDNVTAPTLLIVGDRDDAVIGLNEQAFARLQTLKNLRLVPGATHLFEEPGTLEQASALATEWFERYVHR